MLGVRWTDGLLADVPRSWPELTVHVRICHGPPPRGDRVNENSATVALAAGGWVSLSRRESAATYSLPSLPSRAAIVHPHLASAVVIASHWLGRETFHAGAFVAGGGVWAVLGEKGAGKSSLLAHLAGRGVPVFTDDVLVVAGSTALAGPRSIDLRKSAARWFGAGEPLGLIGTRERFRLAVDPVAAELPLRGWILLRWGESTSLRHLRGADRLLTLGAHRGSRLYPTSPARFIHLASLPVLELTRPRRWGGADEALGTLLQALQ